MGQAADGKSMNQQNRSKTSLVIASGNLGKVREFRKLLMDVPIRILPQPEGLQIEESGKTFVENARLKALAVANASGSYTSTILACCSGVFVACMGYLNF